MITFAAPANDNLLMAFGIKKKKPQWVKKLQIHYKLTDWITVAE